jgi:hypothetical protein
MVTLLKIVKQACNDQGHWHDASCNPCCVARLRLSYGESDCLRTSVLCGAIPSLLYRLNFSVKLCFSVCGFGVCVSEVILNVCR